MYEPDDEPQTMSLYAVDLIIALGNNHYIVEGYDMDDEENMTIGVEAMEVMLHDGEVTIAYFDHNGEWTDCSLGVDTIVFEVIEHINKFMPAHKYALYSLD